MNAAESIGVVALGVGGVVALFWLSIRRNVRGLCVLAGVALAVAIVYWAVGASREEAANLLLHEDSFASSEQLKAKFENARSWYIGTFVGLAVATLAGWSAVLVWMLSKPPNATVMVEQS